MIKQCLFARMTAGGSLRPALRCRQGRPMHNCRGRMVSAVVLYYHTRRSKLAGNVALVDGPRTTHRYPDSRIAGRVNPDIETTVLEKQTNTDIS